MLEQKAMAKILTVRDLAAKLRVGMTFIETNKKIPHATAPYKVVSFDVGRAHLTVRGFNEGLKVRDFVVVLKMSKKISVAKADDSVLIVMHTGIINGNKKTRMWYKLQFMCG